MKKRVLNVLLAIVMVVGMFPVTAGALPAPHTHPVCGATCTHNDDHSTPESWTKLTASNLSNGTLSLTDGKSYYLGEDITVSSFVEISGEVNLCLNGHVLSLDESAEDCVIVVDANSTLNLCDCNGTSQSHKFAVDSNTGLWTPDEVSGTESVTGGVITGGKYGGIYAEGELNQYGGHIVGNQSEDGGGVYLYGEQNSESDKYRMFGGSVIGNTATECGGGIYIYRFAEFELHGGTVSSNRAGEQGGGIYTEQGGGTYTKFTMTDGTVSGNTAADGGGIYSSCAITMSGGSITGNTASDTSGGVYARGTMTMSGGSITGNTAGTSGGGLYLYSSTTSYLVPSGKVIINNNTLTSGVNNNVYKNTSFYTPVKISGTLDVGSSIGISFGRDHTDYYFAEPDGQSVTSLSTGYKDYFFSDDSAYVVVVDGDNLKLAEPPAVETHSHPICGATCAHEDGHSTLDSWTAWSGTGTPSGNVYLTGDVTLAETLIISSGTVNLCLNGYSITRSDWYPTIRIEDGATLNLCDCNGSGKNNGSVTNNFDVCVVNDGALTVYGGTVEGPTWGITNKGTLTVYGGSVASTGERGIYNAEGTVYVYGGTVSGNYYGIYNEGGTANVTGGTVTATRSNGYGIYNRSNGTVTVSGGTVTATGSNGFGIYNHSDGASDVGTTTNVSGTANVSGSFLGIYNSGTLTVSGGTVKSTGTDGNNYGIYNYYHGAGSLELSGAPTITGATAGVYLDGGSITLGGELTYVEEKAISVGMETPGTFTSGWNSNMSGKTPGNYFTSAMDGYTVQPDGSGELKLAEPPAVETHAHDMSVACGGSSVTFEPWDGTTTFPGGNVYLTDDITLTEALTISGTVNLCLNGHKVSAEGGYFDVSGTLNLCSCKDNGIIKRTTTTNALISADAGATANLYNVTLDGGAVWEGTTDTVLKRGTTNSGITSSAPLIYAGGQRTAGGHITLNSGVILQNNECSDAGDGGAITLGEDGTLVINGATICNNAKTDGNAGAIKAYAGAQITLNSGEIYGNEAYKHGGAIQIFGGDSTDYADAVLTMNGSTIRNNKADGVGGGVAVSDYSQFVMNGGSIVDNATTDSQQRGGGVGFADANTAMLISGNAVISRNTANNLYIGTYSCNKLTVDALGSGANIGVTMKSSSGGVFTISGATYADKFISDSSAYAVAVDGSNLKLVKQFTVSFDNNSGTGSKDSVKVSDGDGYTLPSNPFTAPSGYQFKGWAKSANGDVISTEMITVTANTTLYAIWEKIPAEMPTVAVSENLTLTYGEYTGQKFTATIEQKDGYTYEYQWIYGNTVISNTDTLAIPDDLTVGEYDYYLAVGAKRIDNGEITWYSNPDLLVKVNPKELDASNITLSKDAFTYDGNEQKPTVTVNVGGKTLTENTDYTVTWPSDCKNAGTKTITIIFKRNYGGTAQANYEIKQKEIGISWGATEFIPYTGELIVPQATATSLVDGDVCTLTTSVVETTGGAGIVPGRWHSKVTSLSNDNYCLPVSGNLVEVEYGIVKGYIAAPVVSGIDETIKGKADGKINGLTTTMEYATEYTANDDKYTKVMDANMTFAAGTYYVRYQAAGYYNASPFTEVTIKDGGLLNVSVPATQTGYTLTVADTELVWNGNTTLSFELANGYSKTDAFAVKVNGDKVELDANGKYVITNAQENITIAVEGVADTTAPTAEITLATNKWNTFLNNITFGLFFKKTQSVTITAEDVNIGSGLEKVYYYLATEELTEDEVKALADWEEYNGVFSINPNNEYIIYAKVVDKAGNVAYISSEGIVLDAIVPVIIGVENDGTYYGNTQFSVDESYIDTVIVDESNVNLTDGKYTITADGKEHTIVVTDKAGNSATVKVTVITIASLDDTIENIKTTDVKSTDKEDIQEVLDFVNSLINSGKDFTDEEDEQLSEIKSNAESLLEQIDDTAAETKDLADKVDAYDEAKVTSDDKQTITDLVAEIDELLEGDNLTEEEKETLGEVKADAEALIKKIDDAAAATDTENTEKVKDVTDKTVTPEDKTDLEKAKADLEKALEDNNGNYTEDEKKTIKDEIKRIDDALEVIGNVEAVEDLIDKLPENITKNDEDAIKAADDAYNALSDYEKSLVDEDAKKALDDAKVALAELNKPADTDSPQTGDNSNMFLWIALLFISGGAVITLTVVDRKKRMASKR